MVYVVDVQHYCTITAFETIDAAEITTRKLSLRTLWINARLKWIGFIATIVTICYENHRSELKSMVIVKRLTDFSIATFDIRNAATT
jgi:hypothetical protein